MGYININADVEIKYRDIDTDDIVSLLEDRLSSLSISGKLNERKELEVEVLELFNIERDTFSRLPGTPVEDQTKQVLKALAAKYTLEELEKL